MALAGFVTHGMWRPSKRGLCRIPGGGGQGGQGLVTDIRTDTLRWGPAEFEVHVERASRLIEIQVSRLGQRKGLGSSTPFNSNSLGPKHNFSLVPVGREGAEPGFRQRGAAKAQ